MGFSKHAIRWGIAKESVRLTAETTPTAWLSLEKGSDLDHKLELLKDNAQRGVKGEYAGFSGVKVTSGKAVSAMRARDMLYFLHMILGAPVTAEQAVVTVEAGVNDKIDFTEDAGSAKVATLTAGSYAIGASSATAGSFCKLIKDQLEAANETSETYTVAYSMTTRKFTITKGTGVFVLKWNTGANKATCARSLLGFNDADSSSAIAATSDVAVSNRAFKHTFSLPPSGIQPPTYTFFCDRSLGVKKYNGVAVKKFGLKSAMDALIMHESELIGLDEADGSIGSPSWTDEGNPLSFQHVTSILVGGVAAAANIKEWAFNMDSNAFAKRVMSASQVAADIIAADMLKVDGNYLHYFESETERAKFIANTTTSLAFLVEGDTIAGAVKEALNISLTQIQYKAYPYGEADNLLAAQVGYQAHVSGGSMGTIELTNKVASV